MRECPECEICYADEVLVCPLDKTETKRTLPGTRLLANRYLLEKRIGRGAMGQVYLALDNNLGTRRVAVKTIRQDVLSSEDLQEGEAVARFEREARAAASVHHPHIVDVTDFGETENGIFYLVMEYVEGETLHKLLRREGTLPIRRAVNLLRQIADGVEAAHDAGILHRDLKPSNIFIMKGKSGDDGFVKIGDFGLAKIISRTNAVNAAEKSPESRGIVGTPEFMSPEQMQPEIALDNRADIYALGTIAYLMIGGKSPFSGDLTQIVMQKVSNSPPPLSTLRADIPKDVEKVIMNSLEINRELRPATAADWISTLEKAAENVGEEKKHGFSKLIVLAPIEAEVYIDDERRGSIGRSGRLILSNVPAGKHVLRVSKTGEKDDERVIEIREDAEEQLIQAKLNSQTASKNQPDSLNSSAGNSNIMPEIVACRNCGARFAEGVKFCGRCGHRSFDKIENPDEKNCPRCNALNSNSAKFCGKCGADLAQPNQNLSSELRSKDFNSQPNFVGSSAKICGRCNAKLPSNAKFCGLCGKNLI